MQQKLSTEIEVASKMPVVPNPVLLPETEEQRLVLEDYNFKYYVIGKKIDYFQKKQLGYCPPDPFKKIDFSCEFKKKYLSLLSETYFQMLQIMILGFDLIESTAKNLGRKFPFSNPRELFVAHCRQEVEAIALEILEAVPEREITFTNIRSDTIKQIKLYSGREEPQREKEVLDFFKTGDDLWNFTLYAIWDKRLRGGGDLTVAFKKYLKAYRSLSGFFQQKNDRYRLGTFRWIKGKPYRTWRSTPAKFQKPSPKKVYKT